MVTMVAPVNRVRRRSGRPTPELFEDGGAGGVVDVHERCSFRTADRALRMGRALEGEGQPSFRT
jgi:hypothetical protein